MSWHWIFLINLPLGLAALAYDRWALAKDSPEPTESFDFVGMLLMSPGLAAFLYGISSIPEEGTFFSPKVLGFTGLGLALIVSFVFLQLQARAPAA